MQFAKHVPENDEQYLLRTITWRDASKLHGQLCYTCQDWKKLEKRTIWFLKIAEKHNLCFEQSKCDFDIKEIPILGVVVGRGEAQMENDKVKAVKE